jgi:hypothetical protein
MSEPNFNTGVRENPQVFFFVYAVALCIRGIKQIVAADVFPVV